MTRNRKSSPGEQEEEVLEERTAVRELRGGFFVPVHPVLLTVLCYGLYLTVSSAVCPIHCLPSFLPLASLASYLGTEYPIGMSTLAGVAVSLHLMEALYTFYLTRTRLNMKAGLVFLWTFNILLGGIFGLWVLLFPRTFLSISGVYCRIPASFCYNVHN